MDKSSSKQPRGFVRHGAVAQRLRLEIARGQHSPGSRLPAHIDLQRKFGTTPVTVQRAIDQLRVDGFIRTQPNSGTYVADFPPHLWRYALLIDQHPRSRDGGVWSRFYEALRSIVTEANALGPRQIEIYSGVDGHADSEDSQRLLADLAAHRLAGVMFGFAPHDLVGTPLLERPGIFRTGRYHMRGMMPGISGDWMEPLATAIHWIAAQGRRDLSVITVPQTPQAEIQKQIEAGGLRTLPFWMQAVDAHHTEWVRHAVYGILHSNHARLPDAMLVTDDHLVEAVADALIEFGVRVPDDMLVVGHWNFPLKFNRDLPVQLIGLDNVDLLRHWLMAVDAQRRGEKVARETILKPVLEGRGTLMKAAAIQQLPAPMTAS
jgi:DNA-binding LacI/PurR family transcriptional regulator